MMSLCLKMSKPLCYLTALWIAQASLVSAQSGGSCIKNLNTIYEAESKVADDSKLRKYILCPNTEFYVALNFAANGKPLDGQYPIPVGRPNIQVLCGEDGRSENNCQLVRGLVHVGIVDEFKTGANSYNVLLQGLTFFRATSVNVIAMTGGDVTIRDCVFKRNRNVASIYAVAPHNSLRRLSTNPTINNFLDARRRTSEVSGNITKSDLHIRISSSVFSDNVLGASPGADKTAVIYSAGASVELINSVIVSTTKDVQKIEDLPHIIYVESAPIVLRNNCFIGNDESIAPVVAHRAVVSATSNFNQRTTSTLSKSNCEFIAHNANGQGFACIAADSPVCTGYPYHKYRFPCVSYLDDIYFSEWDITDSSVIRTYLLCPDSTFRVGSRHDNDGTPLGGSYPIVLGRSNIRVLCGVDGRLENNCAIMNGVVQVAHFDEYQTGGAPIVNAMVRGVSFTGASAINALLSGSGDVTFQDCVFEGNSNVAAVYVQGIEPDSVEIFKVRRRLHSVVSEVANALDERLLSTNTTSGALALQARFESCSFINNTIGSATNPVSGLISNHDADLSIANSIFTDTLNHVSTDFLGYYSVAYLIGNFNGEMTLQSNCFFDNEVSIAPIINQGILNATENSGRQAIEPTNSWQMTGESGATARVGSGAEWEALNLTNHEVTANSSFPGTMNNTFEPAIDTRNARCEFIASIEEIEELGSQNPELVAFTCEAFDSEVCVHPDAPTSAPSEAPSISSQPSTRPSSMPSQSPTVEPYRETNAGKLLPPEMDAGSGEESDVSSGVALEMSATLALSILLLTSSFQ